MTICCVLMASGFGKRFGGNKLLAPVAGVPMIARAFAALPPELFDGAVVVSGYPEILRLADGQGYKALENREAEEGISASLRLGLSAFLKADGVLFAVCDQPYLTAETVARLLAAFRETPDRIVAPAAGGRRGNPVLFPRDLFPELLALRGDTGGSAVVRRHPGRLFTLEVPPRELEDLDFPLPPGD